jgi:hypothetical protein
MTPSTIMLVFRLRRIEKPERNDAYLRWLRKWPCIACKRQFRIEAAHTGPHGLGTKSSDYSCIPLCHECHRQLHRIGPVDFQEAWFLEFSELRAMYRAIFDERAARKAA